MQDIQSIGNGMGSLYGGGQPLKPDHHQGFVDGHGGYHRTSLKCPRCHSVNTKFCYYNNYNLSQPRFFCKGCRRYWTKGGVLRNVPVGGGCRKTKTSKQKSATRNHSSAAIIASELKPSNLQNSCSDSSPVIMKAPFSVPMPFSFPESCFDSTILDQSSADSHRMFLDTGTFKRRLTSSSDLEFSPASEMTSLMQQQDKGEIVESQDSTGEINDGVAVEDHQSYRWNNI